MRRDGVVRPTPKNNHATWIGLGIDTTLRRRVIGIEDSGAGSGVHPAGWFNRYRYRWWKHRNKLGTSAIDTPILNAD